MKKLLLSFFSLFFTLAVQAQYTSIPDQNFEKKLIELGHDDVLDGRVLTVDIETIATLDVSTGYGKPDSIKIKDIRGIEDFLALKDLDCRRNMITDLDVSRNTLLETLSCSSNQIQRLNVTQNPELVDFFCHFNKISNLDLGKNLKLERLNCKGNEISAIDVSKNLELVVLKCASNEISNLDLSNNSKLLYLECYNNKLKELDVSNLPYLDEIECQHNQIQSLDLSQNLRLRHLWCYNNKIKYLNLTQNRNLVILVCFENELNNINLLNNKSLRTLHCSGNKLTSLDLSNNPSLNGLSVEFNDLLCINVASESIADKANANQIMYEGYHPWSEDLGVGYSTNCNQENYYNLTSIENEKGIIEFGKSKVMEGYSAKISVKPIAGYELDELKINGKLVTTRYHKYVVKDVREDLTVSASYKSQVRLTSIPDVNFEKRLIELGFDNVLDQKAYTWTLEGVEYLNLLFEDSISDTEKIRDLTGIEEFKSLKALNLQNSLVENLDVGNSIELEHLSCMNNQLNRLSLTKNKLIKSLILWNNKLEYLDVSGLDSLSYFIIEDNPNLFCVKVASQEVADKANSDLPIFDDIPGYWGEDDQTVYSTNCENMEGVNFNISIGGQYGGVVSVDSAIVSYGDSVLVSVIPNDGYELKKFLVNKEEVPVIDNQFLILDIKSNLHLEADFEPIYYDLTLLTSNGGSASIPRTEVRYGNSLRLTLTPDKGYELGEIKINNESLQIDNPDYYKIDSITSDLSIHVSFIPFRYTDIPDLGFEYRLMSSGLDDVQDGKVRTSVIEKVKYFGLGDNKIYNLSGIEDFSALEVLTCEYLDIKKLDLSKNTKLRSLSCSGNKLTHSLDLSENINLESLSCSNMGLSNLDLSHNTLLKDLRCYGNNLTELDLSNQIDLKELFCTNNELQCVQLANQLMVEKANKNEIVNDGHSSWREDKGVIYSLDCSRGNLINLISNVGGSISSSNLQPDMGANIIITINPEEGYFLKNLSINGITVTPSGGAYTVHEVTENITAEATFEKIVYHKLSTNISLHGSISLAKDSIESGESISFTVTANDGYQIQDVLINSKSIGSVESYTLSDIQEDKSIEAIFEKIEQPIYYQLTTNISLHGSISLPKDSIEAGESISFTATANDGYQIQDVLINSKSIGSVESYTLSDIQEDKSIEAIFEKIEQPIYYQLITNISLHGSISLAKDSIESGESISFSVTANYGYQIQDVLINSKSIGAVGSYTLSDIQEDKSIEAIFEKIEQPIYYQLTTNISLHGSISLPKDSIEAGESISFTATANDGYQIQDVLVNGKSVGVVEKYTLSDIQEDKMIEAVFVKKAIVLGASDLENISIHPNPVKNKLTISGLHAGEKIQIIDLQGNVLFGEIAKTASIEFDLTSLKTGVYFVSVEERIVQKILKK